MQNMFKHCVLCMSTEPYNQLLLKAAAAAAEKIESSSKKKSRHHKRISTTYPSQQVYFLTTGRLLKLHHCLKLDKEGL